MGFDFEFDANKKKKNKVVFGNMILFPTVSSEEAEDLWGINIDEEENNSMTTEDSYSGNPIEEKSRMMANKIIERMTDILDEDVAVFASNFKVADLDKPMNEDNETLREFIRDSEKTFSLTNKKLSALTDEELGRYVYELDMRWALVKNTL